jgi:hypothetical protein
MAITLLPRARGPMRGPHSASVTKITYPSEKLIEYRRGWKQPTEQERSVNTMSKFSLRDRLTMTTSEGKIELKEEELSRVTGGTVRKAGKAPLEFLKIKLTEVFVSSY